MSSLNLRLTVTTILATALTFVVDLNLPLGVADGVPYALIVLLTLWMPGRWASFAVASIASALTIAGYFLKPLTGETWAILLDRGLGILVIWICAILVVQRKEADRRREEALAEREEAVNQLKILKGLLPICSNCKKIRQESGAWQQLETYICNHSEAEFTHSICPDCMETLYSEFLEPTESESS